MKHNRSEIGKQKKKIVVLVDWFIPAYKAGGPIQSCANFAFALEEYFQIFVIAGDTDVGDTMPYVTCRDKVGPFETTTIRVCYLSKKKRTYSGLLSVIRAIEPDFVYLNHLFSVSFVLQPLLMGWLGQLDARFVVCPRGALFTSALHYKKTYLKKIIVIKTLRYLGITKQVKFHATNEQESDSIKRYFPHHQSVVINNLPNIKRGQFTSLPKRKGELDIIFVARIVPIKNLKYLLQLLKFVDFELRLTIVGPVEDIAYWKECLSEISQFPINVTAEYVGAKPNIEIKKLLASNHLYVLPTLGENFGHSIFEAFQIGRPVLISDKTPWQKLEEKKIGWDLALEGQHTFLNALQVAAYWDQDEFEIWCQNSREFAAEFINNKQEIGAYIGLFSS